MKQNMYPFNIKIGIGLILALLCLNFTPEPAAQASAPPPLLAFSSGGHVLGFAEDGFYLSNGAYAFKTTFVGAHPVKPISAQAEKTADFESTAPPLSGQVSYPNLWPGITLVYDWGDGLARSTYTVAARVDPAAIRLRYNVPASLNADGSLNLSFATGTLTESAPLAWQVIDGRQVPVDIAFRLSPLSAGTGVEVGFALGDYDSRYPLLIDPTLTWNTFLGGTGIDDEGYSVALDSSGNIYVAGASNAAWAEIPVRSYSGNADAFVAKLDATGNLVWHTFLGGSENDKALSLAVVGDHVYVAGFSSSVWTDPAPGVVNPYQAGNGIDAFVARLSVADGSLDWHTFLGGSGLDRVWGLVADSSAVYVAGLSTVGWVGPVQGYNGGAADAFAARLNSENGSLAWHTFIGGTGDDRAFAIASDGNGFIYVTGRGSDTWGSPVQSHTGSGNLDVFAVQLNVTNGNRGWNTFLGGSGIDGAQGIAATGASIYIVGTSNASWGDPEESYAGSDDAFAARLNSSDGVRVWHTFLGSAGEDSGFAVDVDANDYVYVVGHSGATWGSPLRDYSGGTDTMLVWLYPQGSLVANAFLGGSGNDYGWGITLDGDRNSYVTGITNATWGSPVRAYTPTLNDVFVAKLPPPAVLAVALQSFSAAGQMVLPVVGLMLLFLVPATLASVQYRSARREP
ncbi:MAG: SBBP repeat-containing protein [Chloroflexota bacterium]